ncbi:MAG: type II 3-dehydroquinate dehydratase, partial [Actinomycetes bacterium]
MTEASAADTGRGTILVINGPNLNLLGTREPEKYGTSTLADVEELAASAARAHGFAVECVQSNHEGVLLDTIHAARGNAAGIIINA